MMFKLTILLLVASATCQPVPHYHPRDHVHVGQKIYFAEELPIRNSSGFSSPLEFHGRIGNRVNYLKNRKVNQPELGNSAFKAVPHRRKFSLNDKVEESDAYDERRQLNNKNLSSEENYDDSPRMGRDQDSFDSEENRDDKSFRSQKAGGGHPFITFGKHGKPVLSKQYPFKGHLPAHFWSVRGSKTILEPVPKNQQYDSDVKVISSPSFREQVSSESTSKSDFRELGSQVRAVELRENDDELSKKAPRFPANSENLWSKLDSRKDLSVSSGSLSADSDLTVRIYEPRTSPAKKQRINESNSAEDRISLMELADRVQSVAIHGISQLLNDEEKRHKYLLEAGRQMILESGSDAFPESYIFGPEKKVQFDGSEEFDEEKPASIPGIDGFREDDKEREEEGEERELEEDHSVSEKEIDEIQGLTFMTEMADVIDSSFGKINNVSGDQDVLFENISENNNSLSNVTEFPVATATEPENILSDLPGLELGQGVEDVKSTFEDDLSPILSEEAQASVTEETASENNVTESHTTDVIVSENPYEGDPDSTNENSAQNTEVYEAVTPVTDSVRNPTETNVVEPNEDETSLGEVASTEYFSEFPLENEVNVLIKYSDSNADSNLSEIDDSRLGVQENISNDDALESNSNISESPQITEDQTSEPSMEQGNGTEFPYYDESSTSIPVITEEADPNEMFENSTKFPESLADVAASVEQEGSAFEPVNELNIDHFSSIFDDSFDSVDDTRDSTTTPQPDSNMVEIFENHDNATLVIEDSELEKLNDVEDTTSFSPDNVEIFDSSKEVNAFPELEDGTTTENYSEVEAVANFDAASSEFNGAQSSAQTTIEVAGSDSNHRLPQDGPQGFEDVSAGSDRPLPIDEATEMSNLPISKDFNSSMPPPLQNGELQELEGSQETTTAFYDYDSQTQGPDYG